MPTIIEIKVEARINGHSLGELGFPWIVRQVVDEIQAFDYQEPADNNTTTFSVIPVNQVDSIQAMLLKLVDAVGIRIEGSESGSVALRFNTGGILVALNCTGITNTNATINNPATTADARVIGCAGGT